MKIHKVNYNAEQIFTNMPLQSQLRPHTKASIERPSTEGDLRRRNADDWANCSRPPSGNSDLRKAKQTIVPKLSS